MKRAMTRKRHRPEEIVAKLREVDEALSQGKTLEDVAKSLGVSLLTISLALCRLRAMSDLLNCAEY